MAINFDPNDKRQIYFDNTNAESIWRASQLEVLARMSPEQREHFTAVDKDGKPVYNLLERLWTTHFKAHKKILSSKKGEAYMQPIPEPVEEPLLTYVETSGTGYGRPSGA